MNTVKFEYFGDPELKSEYWREIEKTVVNNRGTVLSPKVRSGSTTFCWAYFPRTANLKNIVEEMEELESVGSVIVEYK